MSPAEDETAPSFAEQNKPRKQRRWRIVPRSLRGRLTALFALASAVVVAAGAAFLFLGLTGRVDEALDRDLRLRTEHISDRLRSGSVTLPENESFAQVFLPDGRAIVSSALVDLNEPLLDPQQVAFVAAEGSLEVQREVPVLGGRARIQATPLVLPNGLRLVVVVGASRELEAQERQRLRWQLAFAAPTLFGFLTIGGWLLAGAALRPVIRMTSEAEAISSTDGARRLLVPTRGDEIAHLGETLNAMLARIEQAVARERAFVDDASHELRTPLAIMRAELDLALAHPGDENDTRMTMRSLLDEVERLTRLSDDLLVLARSGGGQLRRHDDSVELLRESRAIAERLKPTLRADLRVEVSGEPATAVISAERLERLLTNLLSNSDRHAESRVAIDVRLGASGCELSVADDGPGFATEVLGRAFERFSVGTPSRTKTKDGTGIGLAIVKALVEVQGGSATAANNGPLGGAVVTLHLPRAGADPPSPVRSAFG